MRAVPVRIVVGDRLLAEVLALRLKREPDIVVDGCPAPPLSTDPGGTALDVFVGGGESHEQPVEVPACEVAYLVVVAIDDDPGEAVAAARAGAAAWLPRSTTVDDLLHILRSVGRGYAFYPREVLGVVLRALRADVLESQDPGGPLVALGDREREVLAALAGGRTGPEIATDLSMSYNTLRTHTNEIFKKLGVHSRLEAVQVAHSAGFVFCRTATSGATSVSSAARGSPDPSVRDLRPPTYQRRPR